MPGGLLYTDDVADNSLPELAHTVSQPPLGV